jgi:hypothetical protein
MTRAPAIFSPVFWSVTTPLIVTSEAAWARFGAIATTAAGIVASGQGQRVLEQRAVEVHWKVLLAGTASTAGAFDTGGMPAGYNITKRPLNTRN